MEVVSPMLVREEELGEASKERRDGDTYSTSRVVWGACAEVWGINPRYTTPHIVKTPTAVVPDEWQTFCHCPFIHITCLQRNAGYHLVQGAQTNTTLDAAVNESATVTG